MNPKPNSGRKSQARTNKMPWNSVRRDAAKLLNIKKWSTVERQE
jgi:hypothetical protein